MSRDPIRPKNEPNLTRTVGGSGLTHSSQVTSPFKAVALASPKPSPSVSKPSTATSSDPFVSPAKPAAISAHSNQYVSKSSECSNEPSLSRLLHPSLSKASSPTPQVHQHSSPIPEPFKRVQHPVFSDTKPPPISAHSNQNVAKPPRPSDQPSSSRVQSPSWSKTTSPTPKVQERSAKQYKPVLRAVSPVSPDQQKETVYVQKDTSPLYNVPEDIEDLIKRDIVPGVLQKPLSPLTYRDYFAALLYAEDVYIEKWTDFILEDVTLELHQLTIYKNVLDNDFAEEKTFVKFKMESVHGRRPFLLSRDFVFAKPLDERDTQFQGFVHRVEKSSIILAEFGDDFHSQHHSRSRYNISFSFNRICLKRAHQAVEAATDPSFGNFLFPICATRRDLFALPSLFFSSDVLYSDQRSAIQQIVTLKGSAPFLLEGPLCTHSRGPLDLSKAGVVVREAVSQVYRRSKDPRILVAAPTNKTCDVLMRSLKKDIPDSEIFRANAAFREHDGVPDDILPSCLYKKKSECFACPPLQELRKFKVIFSTFVSSFRLHSEGINAGHFSHIFLVDASSTSEPEAMIVLANLANEDTTVIVTGAQGNRSGWVRSPIARKNGLRISYFERLKEFTPYKKLDPKFIARLDPEPESNETNSCLSY
ncbi:probable RNA helicase SDE3 [Rhodamnia argentea]|uniref:Probable RNA helicase SDE3 n=1 Tax=Rhodamnia argentea TaxID=178133 RepID=A0ABM3HVA9_9MYRT|nr:probable RNA helicase SDE3 [Rhodamnia argentea]